MGNFSAVEVIVLEVGALGVEVGAPVVEKPTMIEVAALGVEAPVLEVGDLGVEAPVVEVGALGVTVKAPSGPDIEAPLVEVGAQGL